MQPVVDTYTVYLYECNNNNTNIYPRYTVLVYGYINNNFK